MDFRTLSEAKAKLSALVRQLVPGSQRIVITNQGRPTAVLIAYEDYLALSEGQEAGAPRAERVLTIEKWRKDRKKREAVLKSITDLFDIKTLSRKGQKSYKRNKVREFNRST